MSASARVRSVLVDARVNVRYDAGFRSVVPARKYGLTAPDADAANGDQRDGD